MAKETTTIIKKILPYLVRQGYSIQEELFFEEQVKKNEKVTGFTDIEVHQNDKLIFLIEAKRDSQKISNKHRKQAMDYGKVKKVPFVIVTNGQTFEIWNPNEEKQVTINGESNLCPAKKVLKLVMNEFRKNPKETKLKISINHKPYTQVVTLKELTNIFKRCHNAIRDIEKDDEHAFSDFSKFLFLKLLEEKADIEEFDSQGFRLPYTQRFAEIKKQSNDEIKASIYQMFSTIQKDPKYGEVLEDDTFHIRNSKTYGKIVKELATIFFGDSDIDIKGSAFEYFLKFNLKGSQLGQYFTPREVVKMMIEFSGIKSSVVGLINPSQECIILDPACGSGGFLITGMQQMLKQASQLHKDLVIDKNTFKKITKRIKKEVFFGCDAKHMLARTAKMNMIIAGDGFTNIRHGNSLTEDVDFLKISSKRTFPKADFVLANPPFGMSESELDSKLLELYDIHTTKGQALFLQKMIKITKPGGIICTVIDEGILNTKTMQDIREHIIKYCFIEANIHLPYVTFEPNYARVSTSVLLLKKKESEIEKQEYPIFMYDLKEIGYQGSGKPHGKASEELIHDLVKEYRKFKDEYEQ